MLLRLTLSFALLLSPCGSGAFAQPSTEQDTETITTELNQLITETEVLLQHMTAWDRSAIKDKMLHRLNENLLLMQLAKDMEAIITLKTDHDEAFYQEVDSLVEYQIGILYVSYQVIDFAKSQRVPFAQILKKYPNLKVDVYKAFDQPLKLQQAKTLFDRWLYLGLVSRY